jgi:prepilin-type N-terminal cleavage/methylation domain-containing protein
MGMRKNWGKRRRPPASSGFTLVEVIVVLSVVLLLSGIAVPLISGYMEDGKRARAAAEVNVIAAAVTAFYKDVGIYPARSGGGADNTLYVLATGAAQPTSNPFTAGHAFATWAMDATRGDVLDNHLVHNRPQGNASAAYSTTTKFRWRGPYLAGPMSEDPWGRPYVINVISAWNNSATNYKRVFVLSAGSNGRIDTDRFATATTDIAGDDIGLIAHQRQ